MASPPPLSFPALARCLLRCDDLIPQQPLPQSRPQQMGCLSHALMNPGLLHLLPSMLRHRAVDTAAAIAQEMDARPVDLVLHGGSAGSAAVVQAACNLHALGLQQTSGGRWAWCCCTAKNPGGSTSTCRVHAYLLDHAFNADTRTPSAQLATSRTRRGGTRSGTTS